MCMVFCYCIHSGYIHNIIAMYKHVFCLQLRRVDLVRCKLLKVNVYYANFTQTYIYNGRKFHASIT